MQSLTGHTAFVFSCKSQGLGSYYSAGDDKTIKIWNNDTNVQNIQCPASIWSLAIDEDKNIYVGCSDGFLRVFTTDITRRAPQSEI